MVFFKLPTVGLLCLEFIESASSYRELLIYGSANGRDWEQVASINLDRSGVCWHEFVVGLPDGRLILSGVAGRLMDNGNTQENLVLQPGWFNSSAVIGPGADCDLLRT